MKSGDFERLLNGVDDLTPRQRQQLTDRLVQDDARKAATRFVEQGQESPACPHCSSTELRRWGAATGLQRYRCKGCKRTFNRLTGTPMARLRMKEKWLEYAEELAEGHSIRKSAERVGVHRNTAFRWRHRFLALPQDQQADRLVGIAEADETFFLESFKGKKRDMPREPRKRGGKARKTRNSTDLIPVLVAKDRGGATVNAVLEEVTAQAVLKVLGPRLATDAVLCADGHRVYRSVAIKLGIPLKVLSRRQGIRVIDKVFHIRRRHPSPDVNAYDSRLKGWMQRFRGVATYYLPSYLGWRMLLERHAARANATDVLRAALGFG